MTAPATISPGLPVEVGEIEKQLGLLWEQSDAGKVRASLVNLVIYSEAPDAIAANTPLLAAIAADHAFRALLVQGNPAAETSAVRAWITAHCHLREAGQKEICSEQVTFQLDGPAAGRLPSIVFSHLDTDLPLYLWWQGALHGDPDPGFWTWVDRLIVDSKTWSDPARQFRLLHEIEAIGRGRCAVCDLTWTRLFHLRYALAQIFDLPAARERLLQLENVGIHHAPGHRITALELLGWLASRLRWTLELGSRGEPVFRRPDGETTRFRLNEQEDAASCLAVELGFRDATASVKRERGGEFYAVDFHVDGLPPFSQMAPAGREKTADILLSELSRSSRHPLFWPSIRAIEPLL
ncbi:MAG: glucose-6-phosphate dehydrogenase assembly protein OpcA [Chthoniobacterales bacterium]|nr:glucose-6-phosphate dehydrogenase assembly protein OpcA [Chthoniobacterales bacterium]